VKKLKENFPLILSIISIGLVSFNTWRGCVHSKKIEDMTYTQVSLAYRPILKIVEKCVIKSCILKFHASGFQIINNDLDRDTADVNLTTSTIDLKTELIVANTGNDLAKIVAFISTDTLSGDDLIRKRLLNFENYQIKFIPYKQPYFEGKEIHPNDSLSIQCSHELNFLEKSDFTLHYLILYENSQGILYDIYYCIRYEIPPVVMDPKESIKKVNGDFVINFPDIFKRKGDNFTSYIYNPSEAKKVKEFLKDTYRSENQ
jgi:hypothetical protein